MSDGQRIGCVEGLGPRRGAGRAQRGIALQRHRRPDHPRRQGVPVAHQQPAPRRGDGVHARRGRGGGQGDSRRDERAGEPHGREGAGCAGRRSDEGFDAAQPRACAARARSAPKHRDPRHRPHRCRGLGQGGRRQVHHGGQHRPVPGGGRLEGRHPRCRRLRSLAAATARARHEARSRRQAAEATLRLRHQGDVDRLPRGRARGDDFGAARWS